MKKTTSVFIIIALIVNLLAALPFASFAVEEEPTVETVDTGIITGDESVKIPVTITGNPGIWSIQIFVLYDADAAYSSVDLTDSVLAEKKLTVFESDMTLTEALEYYFELEDLLDKTGRINYDNTRVVTITVENDSISNLTDDGVLFNVVFDTSQVEAGEYPVNVLCSVYNTINVDDEKIEFTSVNGALFVFDDASDYCLKFGHEFVDGEEYCLHGCGTENPDYNSGSFKVICDGEVFGEFEVGAEVTLPTLALKHDTYGTAYRFFTWSGADVVRGKYSATNETENGRVYTMTMPESDVTLTSDYSYVGDVNGDNRVNSKDLSALKKIITSVLVLDEAGNDRADLDGNDRINSKDISAMKKMLAGSYTVIK
ncbi:MAG: dockerin type I repeat-containing protein [Clostridia bacterium]|nr:dockerin type I repeat-containing protein [Clostridia bacterium]